MVNTQVDVVQTTLRNAQLLGKIDTFVARQAATLAEGQALASSLTGPAGVQAQQAVAQLTQQMQQLIQIQTEVHEIAAVNLATGHIATDVANAASLASSVN